MINCTILKEDYSFVNSYTSNSINLTVPVSSIYNEIDSYLKNKALNVKDSESINKDDCKLYIPSKKNYDTKIRQDYICTPLNWIGYVTSIEDEAFNAKLIDKNDSTTYEIAQFDIHEVSLGDMDLLKEGATFYWSVGFANKNGQVIKQSLLRFKRSIDITTDEFDSIIDSARDLEKSIIWEE